MNIDNQIILNRIKTPDGTILTSYHRHDYKSYEDCNGETYIVDGGNEYLRRSVNIEPYEELSVYYSSDERDYPKIRESFHRGGRGKNGDQPLTWIPLSEMSNEHIQNCIVYNDKLGMSKSLANYLYNKELKYRQQMEIFIEDND